MSSTTVFPAVAPNSTSLITWELRESSVFELLFVTAGMLCVGGILSMTCCVFYIRKLKIEQSTKRDIFRKAWQEFKGKKMSESSDPGSRRTSVHKKNVNNRRRLASSRSSSHHVGSAGPTKKRNRALSNVSSLQDLEKGRDISTADEGTQQILDGFLEVLKQGVSLLIQNERKGKFSPVLLRCDDNHQTIFWQKVSRRNKKVKRAGENQKQQLVVETKKTVVRVEDMVVVAAAVNDNDEEVIGEDGGDNSNPNTTTRKGSYNQQKMKMFSITTKDGNVQAFLAQNLMERDAIVHGLLLMQDDAQRRQTMYI